MSANKCKFCNGSGWYEPKNMGGMMVEPCNRCDAHKKNQAAQKLPQTSADVCPVCGCGEHMKSGMGFSCGGQTSYSDCGQAEDLAISRAAEIERLKGEKLEILALCKRLAALPGDYNTIQDAEFVFRDLNSAIAKFEARE